MSGRSRKAACRSLPWILCCSSQHRLPRILIVADAQQLAGSNHRQPQEFRISLNPSQELRVGELEILQAGGNIGLAFVVNKLGQTEPLHKPPDLSGGHGLQL